MYQTALAPEQRAILQQNLELLGLERPDFADRMHTFEEKEYGSGNALGRDMFLKIWDRLLRPNAPRKVGENGTVQSPRVLAEIIQVVRMVPIKPGDVERLDAKKFAVHILRLLLPPEPDVPGDDADRSGGDESASSPRKLLIPVDEAGKRMGERKFPVRPGQEIGCAVGVLDGEWMGERAGVVAVVPCTQLLVVHRRFARLDYESGAWTITCLLETTLPLHVAGKVIPAGTTSPLSDGDIIILAEVWRFIARDFDQRMTGEYP